MWQIDRTGLWICPLCGEGVKWWWQQRHHRCVETVNAPLLNGDNEE